MVLQFVPVLQYGQVKINKLLPLEMIQLRQMLDGLEAGSPFLFIAKSGDDVYIVNAWFQDPVMANYTTNGLSFVMRIFDFEF